MLSAPSDLTKTRPGVGVSRLRRLALLIVATGTLSCSAPSPSSVGPEASQGAPRATASAVPPSAVPSSITTLSPASTATTRLATPTPATATPAASTPDPATPAPRTAAPTPAPAAAPVNSCGAAGNPWGYNFCGGSFIAAPPANFCAYFSCIASFWNGVGYVMQCADGMFSKSGGRSGSCSSHGGNSRALLAP